MKAMDNPVRPLEPVNMFSAVLKIYEPDLIVADAGYGADRISLMYSHFPRAMYACHWQTIKDRASRVKFMDAWNDSTHEVVVDKTSTIQKMMHKLKARLFRFPKWDEKVKEIYTHITNMRIIDMEDNGVIYQMATRIGADHYACSLAYALIGVDKLTNYGIQGTNTFNFDFM